MSEQQRSTLSLNARDIPIKSVTVFTDRAEVNRSFRVSLKPGLNEIRLENVAGSIEQQSIRVDGQGAASIHEVKFESKPINIENSDLPKVKELTTKLKEVEAEAQKERDLQSIYNARIEALNNAVKTIGQSSTKGDSSNLVSFNETAEASLESFFDYHERKSIELKAKTRVVDERIRTLDLEIQRLNDEINQYRWNMGTKNTISIELENQMEAGDAEVDLAVGYQVYGARWSPSYDIRVKSKLETHRMDISYFGNIQQQTGEDWSDVQLSLSTAQPGLGGDLPKLGTTVVQFYRPPPQQPQEQMYAMRTCMAAPASDEMMNGGAARKMKRAVATAEENVLSTTFTIPVRKTIPSDPSEHKVTITIEKLTCYLHYHCVPKKDTNVFLLATVVNETDYPILAGPASVYVNNSMSAMINLKSTSCGEKLECPLGVDKTVKVIYKPTHKFQTQVGMINKNSSSGNEQRIVVKNTKRSESVLITLHEPVPKSSDEKIKVRMFSPELPKPKDTKTEEDIRIVHLPSVGVELDDLHNLLWTEVIQPEHEKEFIVKWAVEYPHNETVEYVERSQHE
uniref:Protein F37C4.5 n=1 Tax=Panagrolaimus superbus TaxID=310955 RepID=A0A914Y7M8_9BILA